jgi:iron(III) transport system ATP-binding protein
VTAIPVGRALSAAGPRRIAGEPVVVARGIRKTFGSMVALDGLDLELRRGETLALLGPSGCGKTTLLRAIAGLDRPDAGTVEIAGELVEGPGRFVPPERRHLGMVFQDVALFPHLSVAENVAYGVRGLSSADRDTRVAELLELVGMPEAARSRPHELSGGMQQRIALARALAPRPDVVLLDEPFANLDLGLRTQLRGELRRILDTIGASALFVTHDQAEALTIADRVAVMRRGVIDQVDTPERIYAEPATPFVATFIGVANLLRGSVEGTAAETALGPVQLVSETATGRALVLIRPEHVDLEPDQDQAHDDGAGPTGIAARILQRRFAGAELHYEVAVDGGLRLWVEAGQAARRLHVGDGVRISMRPVETVAFTSGGDRTEGDRTDGDRAEGDRTD